MDSFQFEEGDRIRVTQSSGGAKAGDVGRILKIKRGEQDEIVSLDILIDGDGHRTRGTSVYPREVELLSDSLDGDTAIDTAERADRAARREGDQPA